jgi:hypothetical protein
MQGAALTRSLKQRGQLPDPSSKAVAALLPESDTNAPPTNAARHPTNDKSAGDADSSAAATGTLHAQRNRRRHEVPKNTLATMRMSVGFGRRPCRRVGAVHSIINAH